jgi:hypothetical protein
MKWTKKWTQEERNAGIQLTEELMVAAERITIACAYNDAAIELACQRNALRDALIAAQWGFNHCRCSLCGGFNADPDNPGSEMDRLHTKSCPIAIALLKSGESHE